MDNTNIKIISIIHWADMNTNTDNKQSKYKIKSILNGYGYEIDNLQIHFQIHI